MQIGGRVIGEGRYGCAVIPPFLCNGEQGKDRYAADRKDKVGKLAIQSQAMTEIEVSNTLRKIPRIEQYFILNDPKACVPFINDAAIDDWSSCMASKQKNNTMFRKENIVQITSAYGGKAMNSLQTTDLHPRSFQYFKFFSQLLEAGAIMTLHNVCHYDLHKPNILLDKQGVARIIDFGMSFLTKNITQETLNERWKYYDPIYDNEPPEVTVMTGLGKKIPLQKVIDETVKIKPIYKNIQMILLVPNEDSKEELQTFFKQSDSASKRNWPKTWQHFWPGYDSWAIAAILLNLLKIQLTFPEFTNSELWLKKGSLVYKILKQMLVSNPFYRIDCVESLSLWNPESGVLKDSDSWIYEKQKQKNLLAK